MESLQLPGDGFYAHSSVEPPHQLIEVVLLGYQCAEKAGKTCSRKPETF